MRPYETSLLDLGSGKGSGGGELSENRLANIGWPAESEGYPVSSSWGSGQNHGMRPYFL